MAGRPSYKITQQDYSYAWRYIDRAMQEGDISSVTGYMAFRNAHDAELLQTWCDDYLPKDVFEKMKRAIRASRKRSRDYRTTQRKVGIDLDHAAHLHLSSLANELGMSLSDTILHLEEAYWKAQKAGLL